MTITRRDLTTGFLALVNLAASQSAHAGSLSSQTAPPILTVSGKIGGFDGGHTATFDRSSLEALGMSGFTTATPWYDRPVKFEGVSMARLMQVVEATGDTVIATALNDYETRIPLSDFMEFNVLLALKRDGEYMPVRDKGPLFIVYPFDSNPVLKNQRYYGRSAWQLSRLEIQ